jgi:hypothetical protein
MRIYRKLPNINDFETDIFSEVMLKEHTFEMKQDYIAFLKKCVRRYNSLHRVDTVTLQGYSKEESGWDLGKFQEMLGVEVGELWTEAELDIQVKDVQRGQRLDKGFKIG